MRPLCSILKCAHVTALIRQPALPGTLEMCRPGVWSRQPGTPHLCEGVDLPSEPVLACLLPVSGYGTSGPPEGVEVLLEAGPNEEIT